MTFAERIDRCGLRILIMLLCWMITGSFGALPPAHIVAAAGAALCIAGILECFFLPSPRLRAATPPLSVRVKELAHAALTRANARRFMTVALILTVPTFFLPVAVWYYVVIAVNVGLTVLCLAFGKR